MKTKNILLKIAALTVTTLPLSLSAAEVYPERDTVSLNSAATQKWEMRHADSDLTGSGVSQAAALNASGWQNAIVPGTVLNSLVANGVYPEPYFGVNNQRGQRLIPDLFDKGSDFYTYWFRTTFQVPPAFKGKQIWLQLDGINYRAEVWLNGKKLGDIGGMFTRSLFNVSDAVNVSGANTLAVLTRPIDPPNGFKTPTDPDPKAKNENRNGADGAIGKFVTMEMTAGWDFMFKDGIRDRSTGIWRDVKLFATGPVLLRNAHVRSALPLPDTSSAKETFSIEVCNATNQPQTGALTLTIDETKTTLKQDVSLKPGETLTVTFAPEQFAELTFKNPRLWWPFNKGEQFLYHAAFKFEQGVGVSDTLKMRFGIRDVRSDRNTPDQSRIFYVNGKRFFVHGANWIPEAMCRNSRERTEAELRYTRQAGVSFLRFWAGGVTESDDFFALCDELGILVWVEFWMTGDTGRNIPAGDDRQFYLDNVTDTVKRIRSHPSLAYYVSANERERNGIIPIEELLKELDPDTGYQPGSETDGIHDGSPYGTCNPFWYYTDQGSDRGTRLSGFNPEYGTPILPTIDALCEMMSEEDLFPMNRPVWDYLDGDGFHNMTGNYDRAIRQYGAALSIEEYAWKGQMFGGLAHKALWECWNSQRFEYGERFSTGVLFWYLNSANRQTCGRMWDWSLEPTAGLYFSQSAHEPLHVQYDFLKNSVGVNNELPRAFDQLTASVTIYNFDLTPVLSKSAVIASVPADAFVKDVLTVTLPDNLSPLHFIKLKLTGSDGKLLSENFYWRSDKPYVENAKGRTWTGPLFEGMGSINRLPKAEISAAVKQFDEGGKHFYAVTVSNPSKALAFMTWLRLQHADTGKPVRPAFYSDNFFSLLPNETKTVRIEYAADVDPDKTRLWVDGWNVSRKQFANGKMTGLPDQRVVRPLSLAQGKPVTVSGSDGANAGEYAVDLDDTTRWASPRADNHWLVVDLEQSMSISAVCLMWESAYATEFKIQVSDDGKTWKDAAHITNGKGGTETVKFETVSARYVKFLGLKRATGYGFSLWDFAVYP
ncbi:MAG: discoidin domain-containing protein [Verrucomicrobiales bacterium]|jgi:hypothetical protein|nr:discoidin domain-containing protein [Verrucomicrobiales bacterium]